MSDTSRPTQGPGEPVAPAPVTGVSKDKPDGQKRGGGAVAFGILLVIAGVIVLAGRFIPGLSIVNAWPLIIVAFGIVRVFKSRDVVDVLDGLTSVLVGGILLMNTMGMLSWSVWLSVFSLWPLLLIAAGVAIVGKAVSQTWLRALAQLIIAGGLIYGAFMAPAGALTFPIYWTSIDSGPMAAFEAEFEVGEGEATVTAGTADVSWGASKVTVKPGNALAAISGNAPRQAPPDLAVKTEGSRGLVTVSAPPGGGGAGPDGTLDVTLGRDVQWEDVRLKLGAATTEADLSDLGVDRLEVDIGVTNATIKLGERASNVEVRVNAGVSNVKILVPKGATVSVRAQGLMTTRAPGFDRVGGGSPFGGLWEREPASASTLIDIVVAGGIVSLDVETY